MGRNLIKQWLALAGGAFIGGALAASAATGSSPRVDPSYEYDRIRYDARAAENAVARLAERMEKGEVTLEWKGERGYLDSFLEALDISPASQALVFSPTSLQHRLISPKTPRALYFNDETYIGYVQNSSIVEIAVMDAEKGLVFYVFHNERKPEGRFERVTQQCLVCHDSQGAMGGGVPALMALSSVYTENNRNLKSLSGAGNVTDRTPLDERWGGWNGVQPHLGNILLPEPGDLEQVDDAMQDNGNLATLEGAGLFDTDAYPRPTSDMVALLVLEHQLTVQNQLSYVMFKAPSVLERLGEPAAADAPSWDVMPERARRTLTRMLDELVDKLLFVDAPGYEDRIAGLREYEDWFQAQGPKGPEGRSLRELDLGGRLLRYPLSYLIYSASFDGLPDYARDYVYQRLAEVLEGRDRSGNYAHLSRHERQSILEILLATKPAFRPYAGGQALSRR